MNYRTYMKIYFKDWLLLLLIPFTIEITFQLKILLGGNRKYQLSLVETLKCLPYEKLKKATRVGTDWWQFIFKFEVQQVLQAKILECSQSIQGHVLLWSKWKSPKLRVILKIDNRLDTEIWEEHELTLMFFGQFSSTYSAVCPCFQKAKFIHMFQGWHLAQKPLTSVYDCVCEWGKWYVV